MATESWRLEGLADLHARRQQAGGDAAEQSVHDAAERVLQWCGEFITLSGSDREVVHIANRTELRHDDLVLLARSALGIQEGGQRGND